MKLRIEIDLNCLTPGGDREQRADELRFALSEAAKTGCQNRELYRSLFNYAGHPLGYVIVCDEPASEALSEHFRETRYDDPSPRNELPEIDHEAIHAAVLRDEGHLDDGLTDDEK